MAEIPVDQRQIGSPAAPNLAPAAQTHQVLGAALQKVTHTVGDYVQANRVLEEKTLLSAARTDIERLSQKYAADPQLSMEKVQQFQEEAKGIADGILAGADKNSVKTLERDISALSTKYTTKLMGQTYKVALENEKRDLSLAVNELQTTLVNQIQEGDYEAAAKTNQDLAQLTQALVVRGASAKTIINISENTQTMAIAAEATQRLKGAVTQEERTQIMREMAKRPDTPANTKAFNIAYKEYTRLSSLYKEGIDLSEYWQNVLDGNQRKNLFMPAKQADALVGQVAGNLTAQGGPDDNPEESNGPTDRPVYQSLPAYPGQNKTYDYEEELAAEREGRPRRLYLANASMQTAEKAPKMAPNLNTLATAHVMVGSVNSTLFPNEVVNRLHAGNGEQAAEAVIALNYVNEKAPWTIKLDTQTEMIYSDMSLGIKQGRTDYDNMLAEARKSYVKLNETDLKVAKENFDATYSTAPGTRRDNLVKQFTNATGIEANENSQEALTDYYFILRRNSLAANGKEATALDATKREMSRTHGEDKFGPLNKDITDQGLKLVTSLFTPASDTQGFGYVRFPPTKILAPLTSLQINNQLTEQLVVAAARNKNIELPAHYYKIKGAQDSERMEKNFAYPAPDWSAEAFDPNPANYIRLNVPGTGPVEGRVFLKSTSLTEQNNSGMPVWEVWMQDKLGREFPVIDDKSPQNNIMLFFGQTAEQYAPSWAEARSEENFQDAVKKLLADEGRNIYSVFSWNPKTISNNYKQRQAYSEELENIERAEAQVAKTMGRKSK